MRTLGRLIRRRYLTASVFLAGFAVVSAAGAHHRASEEELRRIIRDAGFVPRQRDTLYRTYFLS